MRRRLPVVCLVLGLTLAGTAGGDDRSSRGGHGATDQKPGAAPPAAAGNEVATVSGAYTFRTYCAPCHGADGKGEGPLADDLRYHPADLSLIAARNGGSFPFEKVVRIVDGRVRVKGHGGPDMPVWGDAFKNADTGYDEKRVREKIREVVDYLRTIQAK